MLRRRVLVRPIFLVLLIVGAFLFAVRLSLPLSIRNSRSATPDWFPLVAKSGPGAVAMLTYSDLRRDSELCAGGKCQFSDDEVTGLNAELDREAGRRGVHWSFEVLERQATRQYIHVRKEGDDDIIESWYWATSGSLEPVQHRWLNRGLIFLVGALMAVFIGAALGMYTLARRLGRRWRPN